MTQCTKLGLGTIIRIVVDRSDSEQATDLSELAFAGINRIEALMSAYRADSEVGILNQRGSCENVSDDTREVIEKALHYWKVTGGAFDITALPALKGAAEQGSDGLRNVGRAGSQDIVIKGKEVRFRKEGLGINLGGIAKGYAVDAAVAILRENGVESGFVDAGGDIRVIGSRSDGSPWRIGLADPKSARRMTSVRNCRCGCGDERNIQARHGGHHRRAHRQSGGFGDESHRCCTYCHRC